MSRALVIEQKSSSGMGCKIGRGQNEELPPLCSYPSPSGQAGCDLCHVSLPLGFSPTVVLPLNYPFYWPIFFFIFLFFLQSEPWSLVFPLLLLCSPLGPEPAPR